MQIDLTRQIIAYGVPVIALQGVQRLEARGILANRSSSPPERDVVQGENVGQRSTAKYNLWMVFTDPGASVETIDQLQMGDRFFEKVSGRYDEMFCCYRLVVEEVAA